MKCLLINGSPNRGNTYTLAMTMARRLKLNADFELEEIHLSKRRIPLCEGCYCCFERGESACLHRPLFEDIASKMEDSDALLILSPVYSHAVTPQLKNFIDHFAYLMLRPRFFSKKACVITTSMGKASKVIARYIKQILHSWGVNRVETYAVACHSTRGYSPSDHVVNRLERLTDAFYEDVKSGRLHQPSFITLKRYNASRAKAAAFAQSRLRRFWKQCGMLKHPYYPTVRLGILKKLYGKAVFSLSLRRYNQLLRKEDYAVLAAHFHGGPKGPFS